MTPEQWEDLKKQKAALKQTSRKIYFNKTGMVKGVTGPIAFGRNEEKRKIKEAKKQNRINELSHRKAARKLGETI